MRSNNSIFLPLLLIILVNILFSVKDLSFDLTLDKKHSLSLETKEILENLGDNVFIKVYLDGNLPIKFKYLKQEVVNLLLSFKSIAGKNLDFEFIDPNEFVTEEKKSDLFKQIVNDGVFPTDIKHSTKNSNIHQIIFPGAVIYFKDKKRSVNFLKNSITKNADENINSSVENLEFEFINSIHHLLKTKIDKIAFLEGNGELKYQEVYDLTSSVIKDNYNLDYHYKIERFNIKEFQVDSVNMQPNFSNQIDLMNSYKVIIIAKPTIPFNILDKFLIDQYLMMGGKILWMVDGVDANMDSLRSQKSFIALQNNLNLSDQFFKYGFRINYNIIEDLRAAEIPIITGYSNNNPKQNFFSWPYYPLLLSASEHPISKGLDGIKCDFVSSIDTIKNNIKKTILLTSSKNSRINNAPAKITLSILETPPPLTSFNKQNLPIAVLLEGEFESVFKNRIFPKQHSLSFIEKSKGAKMIIISDGDIARNKVSKDGDIFPLGYDRFTKYTYPGNKTFLMNAIHYLCDDVGLTKLKSKELKLRLLDKKKILFHREIIQLINIILPIFIVLIFSFLFVRFKKKIYV